ncbi:MAG: type I restriction enzyme HsdR N-terminal domain-containing protein [Euryarchaeota archaeon]|nr:type I restriction enzyme HsdR N-terminal domain-containing protein [Euryarchaeota archaeon]
MTESELQAVLRSQSSIVASGRKLSEANTRARIIDPFLRAIGWNFSPDEIEVEYPVQMASGNHPADYCLKVDGNPAAFLEAKALGTEIGERELKQTMSYGRNERVRWCMVCNGSDFIVLDTEAAAKNATDAIVIRFALHKASEFESYLEALSPEGLRKNRLADLADEIGQRRIALALFEEVREERSRRIVATLADVGVEESRIRAEVERLLDQVRLQLEGATPRLVMKSVEPTRLESPLGTSAVGRIRRERLVGDAEALVAVVQATPDGIPFLEKYRAWYQVPMKRNPAFCAFYITKPRQCIRFVAPVERVVPAPEWFRTTRVKFPELSDEVSEPKDWKTAVEFSNDTLWELEDPIPLQQGEPHVQGLIYTTLGRLRVAESVGTLRT